jgi:hypothetical protein
MPTLYRDYRPQKFADILGQNHLKITLQNELFKKVWIMCDKAQQPDDDEISNE